MDGAAHYARRVFLGLALLLGLLFVLDFRPLQQIVLFWPFAHTVWGLGLLLALGIAPHNRRLNRWLARPGDTAFLLGLMLLLGGLLSAINLLVLEGIPHVTDSTAYHWLAKELLHGRITAPSPDLYEYVYAHFFQNDLQGRWFTFFQLGWPAVLALGMMVKAPWLVPPIVGTLTLIPAYRLAQRWMAPAGTDDSEDAASVCSAKARWLLILFAFAPFHLFLFASFMSHALSTLLTLWALERLLVLWEAPRKGIALQLGLLLGALFFTRAYNGTLMILAACAVLGFLSQRRRLRPAGWAMLLAGLLPFLLLQAWQNHTLTGSPFTFAHDQYFAAVEPEAECHSLGFGEHVGCLVEHGHEAPRDGYGPAEAFSVSRLRLQSLVLNLYGLPIVLVVAVLGFRRPRRAAVPAALFLLHFLGYALFYYHGNCYGPRFLAEGTLGVLALFVIGAETLLQDGVALALRWPRLARLLPASALSIILWGPLFSLLVLFPKQWEDYRGFRGIEDEVRPLAEAMLPKPSIVLLKGGDVSYANGFNHMESDLSSPILYLREWGNYGVLPAWYFDRPMFVLKPQPNPHFRRLTVPPYEGLFRFEMESKIPPLSQTNGWAFTQYDSAGIRSKRKWSEKAELRFFTKHLPAQYIFRQWIPAAGDYRLEAHITVGPEGGTVEILVNGTSLGSFDSARPRNNVQLWQPETVVSLEQGMAEFTVRVTDDHHRTALPDVGIDWIGLRRTDVPADKPYPRFKQEPYP